MNVTLPSGIQRHKNGPVSKRLKPVNQALMTTLSISDQTPIGSQATTKQKKNKNMESTNSPRPLTEVFTSQDIDRLLGRIAASGELGRSRTYESLLHYLLLQSRLGKSPKEIEIAIDVLGRDEHFDVSRDSVVRVYIHQLRKKLDRFYETHKDEPFRLCIPKGQYTVAVLSRDSVPPKRLTRHGWVVAACALLCLNLLYFVVRDVSFTAASVPDQYPAASYTPWSQLLDDDLPILVVMGDYYIFGERDEYGGMRRMIRDFSINSQQDLNQLFVRDPEVSTQYADLDLNYMPEGSASALARIVPVLQRTGKQVKVTMMSRLNTADLRSHHIVYIGYVSALDTLFNVVFADSGLAVGNTYDELLNHKTGQRYYSDAGMPSGSEPFRDYGFFSTFPATSQNHMVIVAGTRDAGLMHTAQAAVDTASLDMIERALSPGTDIPVTAYEALFEVFGFNRQNFDASLVHTKILDPTLIWGGELTRAQ